MKSSYIVKKLKGFFFWIIKKTGGQGNKGKLRIWAIYESISWVDRLLRFLPVSVGGISIDLIGVDTQEWSPELQKKELQEKSSSSALGMVQEERRVFSFLFFISLHPCPIQFFGNVNNNGNRSKASERGEPSSHISGAVVPRGGAHAHCLFSFSILALLGS